MNRKILSSLVFVFIIVLSITAVSAEDGNNITVSDNSNTVSGGVDMVTENPWATSGELNYYIPADAKEIKSADVYVNVYGGSAANTHGANANISITTQNAKTDYTETLWIEEGTTDATVYTVNNHTTKSYSDYMIHYDATDLMKGLNGSSIKINVDTFQLENKTFDGRIKLIGLVVGYDDGDGDVIKYWINDDQLWTKTNVTLNFPTESLTNVINATLTDIVLSSTDGSYKLNNQYLGDADKHKSGNYYQYNQWDVTKLINESQTTVLNAAYAGTSSYGSLKNVLSLLVAKSDDIVTDIALATEYSNTCFAGTNNTLTVTVNSNKKLNYTINLLADGNNVDSIETELNEGSNTLILTDSTIRPVDANTVKGANNTVVNYTVQLLFNSKEINSKSLTVPVLYNGNLNKSLAYPDEVFTTVESYKITGGIVIDIKEASTYLSGAKLNRTDVWNIELNNASNIVKAYIYVPYNWWNPNLNGTLKATLNDAELTPVTYTDQGNLGNYGAYSYGLYVYDVTETLKNGENNFTLIKTANTPAVYPSALVYMYNTTVNSTAKTVYITNDADLLAGTSYNKANRTVKLDNTVLVESDILGGNLYVFAAGAQTGEGSIIFNDIEQENVWNGSSQTTDLFSLNITDSIKQNNTVSFVATGSTILALSQIIVTDDKISTELTAPEISLVYNNNKNLIITLTDANGNALSDKNITVSINNKIVNKTTDSNGQVKLAINLKPKTYATTVTFEGDEKYAKSSVDTKVIVKKATPKLTAKNKKFNVKTKTKKYAVVLKTNKSKALKKVKVTLKVNGKTYSAKTNSKGKATFKITKLTKKGKFKSTVKFAGNKYYKAVSKMITITTK